MRSFLRCVLVRNYVFIINWCFICVSYSFVLVNKLYVFPYSYCGCHLLYHALHGSIVRRWHSA